MNNSTLRNDGWNFGRPVIPFEIFPQAVENMVKEISENLDITPEMSLAYFLSLASTALGTSRCCRINVGNHKSVECGNLFIMLFANSGSGKTPAYQRYFSPSYDILQARYPHDLDDMDVRSLSSNDSGITFYCERFPSMPLQ